MTRTWSESKSPPAKDTVFSTGDFKCFRTSMRLIIFEMRPSGDLHMTFLGCLCGNMASFMKSSLYNRNLSPFPPPFLCNDK